MNTAQLAAASTGFALGLTLIVAIGAQNAFVLRQGLRREHVGVIVACCAIADAVLMLAGIAGLAAVLGHQPLLAGVLTAGGALFLTAYGLRALARARRGGSLGAAAGAAPLTRRAALAQTAAFTLLNPHVYLDTVLLLGTIGASFGDDRWWFALGAALGSVVWFVSLGFGARLLSPVMARPVTWRVLDTLIGVVMLLIAGTLLRSALT
jgi:L-lysine exporter family protein LysE/ArgO